MSASRPVPRCPPMRAAPFALAAAAAVSMTPPLLAQHEAWRVRERVQSERLGDALATVVDQDGDGVVELLVGAPGTNGGAAAGRALLLSGRDLAVLREIAGPPGEEFGVSVADAGDLDGDGVNDLFVGSGGDATVGGIARVYSGATGALLRTLTGPDPAGRFGAGAVALGDVDGDGVSDLAIGAPEEKVGGFRVGVVRIHSGATGLELRRFDGSDLDADLGGLQRLANLGDLDGDGVAELGLLDAEAGPSGSTSVARVRSGATGHALLDAKFDSGLRSQVRLTSISAFGDHDGDGVLDFVVGGVPRSTSLQIGRAFVLSGAGLGTLLRVDRAARTSWFFAGPAGDHDGDGALDLALSFADDATNVPTVELVRGSDGGSLGTIAGAPAGQLGRNASAGIDFDGDGALDVAIDDASAHRDGVEVGELRLQRWPSGALIARVEGFGVDHRFVGAVTQMGDFDGDGTSDFAVAHPHTPSLATDDLRIHSGRDGRELRVHSIADRPVGALIAVPDLDGDGLEELAVGLVTNGGTSVDVLSSATGQALLRIAPSISAGSGFGEVLTLGLQANGALHLAIGAPDSSAKVQQGGEVQVYDLASGALLFQKAGTWGTEHLGSTIAFLGDVNGDGTGDWAFGAPEHGGNGNDAGRVLVVSGTTGATLYSVLGNGKLETFGRSLMAIRDQDGDGVGDFAAGATYAAGSYAGEVRFFSGASGALLRTVAGRNGNDKFGSQLAAIDDLNGDGVDEWVARASYPPRFEVHDGATDGRYYGVRDPSGITELAVLAARSPVSADGDRVGDLLLIDPFADRVSSEAWLIALDDLLIHFEPPVAVPGYPIELRLAGGPVGSRCGLLLVDVNGVPVYQWLAIGVLDARREFTVADMVPPGLSGLEYTLQGYAVGLNGRLMESDPQLLRFE